MMEQEAVISENTIEFEFMESPLGRICLEADSKGIKRIEFSDEPSVEAVKNKNDNLHLKTAVKQLQEYFDKERTSFSFPVSMSGTAFQKKVWEELLKIPFGKTTSYMKLSMDLGDKKAIRAVGAANGKNKIAIAVPCHRVIGSDGKLVGYAGELWRKKWLLEFEGEFKQTSLF